MVYGFTPIKLFSIFSSLMSTITLIISTCPNQEVAETIAQRLLEENLAACVSILAGVTSIYRWQGEVVKDQEYMLFIKTATERQDELLGRLRDLHPYDVPEIICLPIEKGHQPYIEWVKECTISS